MKIVISYIIIIFFLFGIVTNGHLLRVDNAFGDGLFMEQLSASLGDRAADLLIKMDPPIVTTETIKDKSQKPTVQFKLFDSKIKSNFKEVTYFITIRKDGKTLLSDWFFNPDGNLMSRCNLKTKIKYQYMENSIPSLMHILAGANSPVVASGPIFLDGGLYHFIVRMSQ